MLGSLRHAFCSSLSKRRWVSLLLLCLIPFSVAAAKDEYLHKIWRAEDGLASPVVRAIAQSKDGYIWLGVDDGVFRFDGAQFKAVEERKISERLERWMVGLAATPDGSVWCSSVNGGLLRVKDGVSTRYTTTNGLPRDYVLSALSDSRSNLWVGTAGGLARFESGRFIAYTNQPGLIVEAVRALAEDRKGKLWIGTAKGISSFDGQKFESLATNFLVNNAVMSLCADSKGVLWIGTGAGLTRVSNGVPTHYTVKNGLLHDIVRAIYEDRAGQIWIGTQGGLQKFVNGTLETVELRHLTDDFEGVTFVYAIYEDREGNLWVGTNLGLSQLQPTKFHNISKDHGLPHNLATLVMETEPGTLWVGTYGGGLAMFKGEQRQVWTNGPGALTSDYILALHHDRENTIWIGTDGSGLNRFKDGKFTQFLGHDVPANTIRIIFEDAQTNIWVGHNLGVSRFENNALLHQTNFPRTTVKAMVQDRIGNMWVASRMGLTRWAPGKMQTYREQNGLCSERVNALFLDQEGVLWIGTEAGLNRMGTQGKFTSFITPNGVFREHILHILEDNHGDLWLSTRNGVYRAKKKELNAHARGELAEVSFLSYGRKDGMRRAQCNGIAQPAGWKLSDGRLAFPTMQGVMLFDPRDIPLNTLPPPVVIEEMIVDGVSVSVDRKIELPPGSKQVEFRYTALSYQAPEKVRFKYRLEGSDTKWEDAGTRRYTRFLHLPPGDYKFLLKACNNDGIWSDSEASYAFTLPRPLYLSPYFYAICGASVFGLGLVVHFMRIRNHRKREQELADLVDQRTEKLQEMVRSMESYNYSIAHDLRAPIRAIRGFTQALVEDYKPNLDELGCEYAQRIEIAVERMDQLIQDLLIYGQLSHKEIPLEHVKLEPLIERILENFAAEIASKEARIEIRNPLTPVWANNTILHQILSNLLGNSLKFVDPRTKPHVQIWTEENGDTIRIRVKDNGIGIKSEYQVRIFRIFERLHPVEVFPGTGIGLAIVQKGTERMGGKVTVESAFGEGSCFTVELRRNGQATGKG